MRLIGVGLVGTNTSLSRLPGMDGISYGYHADDGKTFTSSLNGCKYGPPFSTGDVVGCCLNSVDHTVFFTLNGAKLGLSAPPCV